MPDWAWTLLLVPAGFVAGVVNTIAGGGSFLTLPALMYLCGLDPKIANGTNRIAILLSSASASVTFHKHGHIDRALVLRVGVPTLLGVPVGALLAVYLPPDAFRPVFGAIFLAMAGLLAWNPRLLTSTDRQPSQSHAVEAALFFGIGVYVGFIQAGFGILLLLGLSLFHARDLVGANAVKNVLGFLVTLLALTVFVIHGQIDWVPGLVMAAGNVAGGVVGAQLAIQRGRLLIFATLIVVMVATGVSLLWPRGEGRPDASGSQAQGDTKFSPHGVQLIRVSSSSGGASDFTNVPDCAGLVRLPTACAIAGRESKKDCTILRVIARGGPLLPRGA